MAFDIVTWALPIHLLVKKVESAAERIHVLYRIVIVEECVISSSRALPEQVFTSTNDGAYEVPLWAEQPDEPGENTKEKSEEREKQALSNSPSLTLPRWPESTGRSMRHSESSTSDDNV
ncbi:hypothetical protein N0V82_008305 [Gnomoniopsis sp. IMI 355080]|nr:hypothetical protein N0V82_008305 [Gnomoniopsis sp. IMI 355080]